MTGPGYVAKAGAAKWRLITLLSTVAAGMVLTDLVAWVTGFRAGVIAQIVMALPLVAAAVIAAEMAERRVLRRAMQEQSHRDLEATESAEWGVRGASGCTTPFVTEAVARLHAGVGRPLMNRAPDGEWREVAVEGDPYWDWERP